ncbi:MAG: argininosuccinate lyase, partial [Candidatus Altiarchaeales archaeon]|nr:argininosuccinate lyase [Candidatus Altiarchaeales archaeon]
MAKLWGGRFEKELTETVEEYIQSIDVDQKMIMEDIWGSEAHAIMIGRCGIIKNEELKEILYWL